MNRLRSGAMKDPAVQTELGRLLRDPGAPDALREACAWILGSLAAPEARAALLRALQEPDLPPTRLAVLLRAVGQTKDPEDREDFFDLLDAPWVFQTPSGLGIRVCTDLPDAARAQVTSRLAHPDAAVRQAATEAVRHSLGSGDARGALLGVFPRESQPGVQAEMGDALAAWSLQAVEPEQAPVAALLAQTALGADHDVLRFRLQTELAQLPLAEPAREAMWQALEEGGEPRRRWALGLLEAHRAGFAPEEGRRLLQQGRKFARDPSASVKLREDAARLLGRFPAAEALGDLSRMVRADAAWNVRLVAARSLGTLGGEEALRVLAGVAASDPDPRVREAAQRTLR